MSEEAHHYTAIIIHAPIGGGKTQTCQKLVARAKVCGIQVDGIVSPCIKCGEETVGYDGVDAASSQTFPLVRLNVDGEDWFNYGTLKYSFSKQGFLRANNILSSTMVERSLVIVDEYGRLEKDGNGLSPGFMALSRDLRSGVLAVACRGDLIDHVKSQLNTDEVFIYQVDDLDAIWRLIVDRLL